MQINESHLKSPISSPFKAGIFQKSSMITTTATPLSLSPLSIKKTFKDSKIHYEENNYMKNIHFFDTNSMVKTSKPHHDFKINCISTLQKDNKMVDSNYPFYNPVHTPYVLREKNLYSGQIPKEVMGLTTVANNIEKELHLKNNKKTILTSVEKFEQSLEIAEKTYKKSRKKITKNVDKKNEKNNTHSLVAERNKQRKMDYTIHEGAISSQDTSDEIQFNKLRTTFTIIRKKEKDSLPVL